MSQPQRITPGDVQRALRTNSPSNRAAGLNAAQVTKAKFKFLETAREICPGYELFDEQKDAISKVFSWCMRLDGPLDPEKGLWLWGGIGTGKSTLLRIVNRFCNEVRPCELIGYHRAPWPFGISIRRAIDICDAYVKDGIAGLEPIIRQDRLGIDDLGTERPFASHFGNQTNVIADLLMRRYDMRERFQTHVTTNLKPEQIAEVYDERVYDRVGEMFNFVYLPGYTCRPEIIRN